MARVITREQFSTGTNIDGNRIDKALGDVQDRINSVPIGDIKTAYMPYQLVGGFTPVKSQFLQRQTEGTLVSPLDPFFGGAEVTGIDCWLPATHTFTNTPYKEIATIPDLVDTAKKENPISQKGSLRTTDYFTSDKYVRNYQMSNVFTTTSPLVIDEISIWMGTNGFFDKKFLTVVPGETAGAPYWWGYCGNYTSVGDLQFILSVDDDNQTEIIQLRTNEIIKQDFHAWQGHVVMREVVSAIEYLPTSAGLPSMSYEDPADPAVGVPINLNPISLWFVFKDLNISIPENGRFRLSILVPDYQKHDTYNSATDWTNRPDLFELTWTITGKEEIR